MGVSAYWKGAGDDARIWLRDNNTHEGQLGDDLTVKEAIRLRDDLTKMIDHCISSMRYHHAQSLERLENLK